MLTGVYKIKNREKKKQLFFVKLGKIIFLAKQNTSGAMTGSLFLYLALVLVRFIENSCVRQSKS